jgi:hypothetical protein
LDSKSVDTRNASVGLTGTILNIERAKFAFYSKFGYAYREDDIERTRSDIVTWDNALVSDVLRSGEPYSGKTAWYLTPRFGLVYEDKRPPAGTPGGSSESAFVSFKYELYPGRISDRWRIAASGQRFRDLSVDTGLAKRGETFWKASLDYLLFSPTKTDETIFPSIALERTVGADPLNGISRAGNTQLMFRLKIN